MTTIQAAIFDIGNVILPFDYHRAANRLLAENAPPRPPNRESIVAAQRELELGRITREEFLVRVKPEFGHQGPDETFLAAWENIFDENPPMNELIAELARQMPLYLLSNISVIHRESVHRDYPVFGHFLDGIYSYEAGCMKPDPEIFQIAIRRLGVDPDRTLYIDDLAENIASAREAGFQCVHYVHTEHGAALQEIRRLLSGVPG